MEDGFFEHKLEDTGLHVTIPNEKARLEIHRIHQELMRDEISEEAQNFFSALIQSHSKLDAVALGYTELPLAIQQEYSALPLIDPVFLQCKAAVEYALQK